MFFNLTKTKALVMALIGKFAFNIDNLTIHSTLNILVQQSLFSLPNLSLDSLNRLTCWYEQLQLVVIDEISFIGARTLNGMDNNLRFIKTHSKQCFWWVFCYHDR